MASKGISIPIASDTRDFSQGIKSGVIKPLEGVEDALDDVAREGDTAGEKLEDSMKDASRKTEALEKDYKELGHTIRDEATKSSRVQKAASAETASTAKRTMGEVKQEALQNASETFSSFDGSATSLVQGVQGTLGGLIASLAAISPAFIPIGIGAAAAVGLIASAVTSGEEQTEEWKARVAELTGEYLESGAVGHRSISAVVEDIKKLATETDDSKTNLKDLKEIAKTLGVPLAEVVIAYEQGGKALQELLAKNRELAEKEDERAAAQMQSSDSYVGSLTSERAVLEEQNDLITKQVELQQGAADAAALAAEAGLTQWALKADLIAQVDTAYDEAAGAAESYINKETGLFDTAAYIASMQARKQALEDYQDTLNSTDLSPEAKKFLESQGQDAAASFLSGYKGAAPEQKAELNRIWTEAGKTNSAEYSSTVQSEFDASSALKVKAPVIEPIDTRSILSLAQKELNKTPLSIRVKTVDSYGREIK